jgi:phosphonoacetate hydrolase
LASATQTQAAGFVVNGRVYRAPTSRTLAICGDGWDPEYIDDALDRHLMPHLAEALRSGGQYDIGLAQVPTFTNPNNVSIVTGVSAAHHGVSGNHYQTPGGDEVQMTDPSFLRADTIHEVALGHGTRPLCVTAKDKLRRLLGAGGTPSFSGECAIAQPLPDGRAAAHLLPYPPPSIYDWRLSAYTLDLALALADELDADLVYASLTDYVQHRAAPRDPLSDQFFRAIDARIGAALDAGWRVGITADHGMNTKTTPDGQPDVRYLDDILLSAGLRTTAVTLPITDPYVAHHGGLGSYALITCRDPSEIPRAAHVLAEQPGAEAVVPARDAADRFELPGDRLGDLVVLGDRTTVFGRSADSHDLSTIGRSLRSHGGLHEREVPVILCQPVARPLRSSTLRSRDLHDLLLNH